jgi:hypothetical protein
VFESGAFFEVADVELDDGVVTVEQVGIDRAGPLVGDEGVVAPVRLRLSTGILVARVGVIGRDGTRPPSQTPTSPRSAEVRSVGFGFCVVRSASE